MLMGMFSEGLVSCCQSPHAFPSLSSLASCILICYAIAVEVVEFACGIASELKGELVENVSGGMDTYSIRQPLGVKSSGLPTPELHLKLLS